MTHSFASLKSNRKSQFDKLNTELSKLTTTQPQSQDDDTRFWKPTVDKADNGYAVIRFLPAPKDEDVPFVRIWDHGFKGPGGWYIEKSLTTLGLKDPVSEYNAKLWNSGNDADKETVRKQKRRLTYISNILVVKDPGNPDNEGKVFLFKYGKKIFDKLNEAMNPQYEDEESMNPFDMWEGADFKLKIRKVEGYRNYDKSEFDTPKPISNDDGVLEKIWSKEHSLQEFLAPAHFKSYEELQSRLNKALGFDGSSAPTTRAEDIEVQQPKSVRVAEEDLPWNENTSEKSSSKKSKTSVDEDDVDMEMFKDLLNDD